MIPPTKLHGKMPMMQICFRLQIAMDQKNAENFQQVSMYCITACIHQPLHFHGNSTAEIGHSCKNIHSVHCILSGKFNTKIAMAAKDTLSTKISAKMKPSWGEESSKNLTSSITTSQLTAPLAIPGPAQLPGPMFMTDGTSTTPPTRPCWQRPEHKRERLTPDPEQRPRTLNH